MRKVTYKLFWGWNYEKEDKWLNEMSAKGQQLVSVGLCRYEFEQGQPNQYTYCHELLQNPPPHPDGLEYIQFVEEMGAEHIGTVEGWAYFRRKSGEGEFTLFSDNASLASYNLRMLRTVFSVAIFQILLAFALPAFMSYIMGGWHFSYGILGAISLGFAAICIHGIFRLRKRINNLKADPAVQAGMVDLYGENSLLMLDTNSKRLIVSLLGAIVWVYLYIFFHEAGHALIALMYGNSIESFVVFGPWPHVSLAYPYQFTGFGWGLFFAGGVLFPLIAASIAFCFYKPGVRHYWYHEFFQRIADLLPFITLIVWAGFPLLSLFTAPPPWEDVTRFMQITGFHPLLVALGTIAIAYAFRFLARKKGILAHWAKLRGNQKESRAASAIGVFFMAVFVIIVSFVFAPSPPMFGSDSVFITNATWSDIRLDSHHKEYNIYVEETRIHSIDLQAGANGHLTAVQFISPSGEILFWQAGERIYHQFGLELEQGLNRLVINILVDNYAIEEFLMDIGREDMIYQVTEYAATAFAYIGEDYAFRLFLEIR